MPILNAPQSAQFLVPAGQSLIIGQGGEGNVIVNNQSQQFNIQGAQFTYGASVTIDLNVLSGAINYTVGIPSNTPANKGDVKSSITDLTGIYNFNSSAPANNLMKARAAFAKVRSGASNAKLAIISNSLGAGTGANGGSNTNVIPKNYPSIIKNRLKARGLPVGSETICGDNGFGSLNYDARISFGTNWALGGGYSAGLGGNAISKAFDAGAGTSPLVFTPSTSCDTYEVWCIQDGARGSFTTNASGGLASVNLNGTQDFVKYTGTVTLGQALTITPVGTNQLNPLIIRGYNSATKEVSIMNFSAGGKNANYFAQNSSKVQPIQQLQIVAPDLTIIDNCVNDWGLASSIPQFMIDTQTLINAASLSGDVVLGTQAPSRIDVAPLATQQAFVNALYQLAISNNIPLIDTFGRVISYEIANPAPYQFYYDNKHMTDAGYQDLTTPYVDLLSKLI